MGESRPNRKDMSYRRNPLPVYPKEEDRMDLSYVKSPDPQYESKVKMDVNYHFFSTAIFQVRLGELEAGFKSVQGLESSVEYDVYPEGGANEFVHVFVRPASQPGRLIFEQGVGQKELFTFYHGEIAVGYTFEEIGTVTLFSMQGEAMRSYSFLYPTVVKWELSQLEGNDSQILIRKLEVLHRGIVEEVHDKDVPRWKPKRR